MQTSEKIKEIISYSDNKGPYGLLAAVVTAIMVIVRLTPDQKETLKELWPLLNTPVGIIIISLLAAMIIGFFVKALIGGGLKAYLNEQKARTKVETGIFSKLEQLADDFKVICSNHLEDRNYLELQLTAISRRFDRVDSEILDVYKAIEKRGISHESP
jgi:hypothetical protein